MKKLKVVDDYFTSHEIEADTIDILKDSIMARFSLTADHLSQQRILVRDNRDLLNNRKPITGCVDLLQLADGSILDDLCKDGDSLVLGWKGPFTVHLVTDFFFEKNHNIEVDDNSVTLHQLKQKIETLMDDPFAGYCLPQVLIDGDDDKPLLFFGYYRFWKSFDLPFEIHYNNYEENIPEVEEKRPKKRGSPTLRVATYPDFRGSFCSTEAWKKLKVMVMDDDGNESLIPITEFIIEEPNEEENKYNDEMRRIRRQSKENMENPRKKNNEGMEGDIEEAGCSYVVDKERGNIEKKIMKHEDEDEYSMFYE